MASRCSLCAPISPPGHCYTLADVQRRCSRPFSESAQRGRISRRYLQGGSQQSGLRRRSSTCSPRRKRLDCRGAVSLPRLHYFDCVRFTSHRTTSRPHACRSALNHFAISLAIARRSSRCDISRRGTGRRRNANASAKYCRKLSLVNHPFQILRQSVTYSAPEILPQTFIANAAPDMGANYGYRYSVAWTGCAM